MKKGIDCKGNKWEERPLRRMNNLTGYKFTKLTVLFPIYVQGRSKRKGYWLCRCDCGNEIVCRSDCLHDKKIQSCGCMTIEGVYKKSQIMIDEMIGKKFGMLTVEEFVGYKIGTNGVGKSMLRCKCDCGNDNFITPSNALRVGATFSCGCLNRSVGEINIENILNENKVCFKNEYTFPDLHSNKDKPLRYDFAILNKNNTPIRLIEFDGLQHTQALEYFGGEEQLKIQQEHDELKNQYALSHNIPLVRIPYFLRDIMTLEDLMSDKYLIK